MNECSQWVQFLPLNPEFTDINGEINIQNYHDTSLLPNYIFAKASNNSKQCPTQALLFSHFSCCMLAFRVRRFKSYLLLFRVPDLRVTLPYQPYV